MQAISTLIGGYVDILLNPQQQSHVISDKVVIPDKLQLLVRLQQVNGTWKLDEKLVEIIEVSMERLKEEMEKLIPDTYTNRELVSLKHWFESKMFTVLYISYISSNLLH